VDKEKELEKKYPILYKQYYAYTTSSAILAPWVECEASSALRIKHSDLALLKSKKATLKLYRSEYSNLQ